jgi:small subunit ribosomal protein S8
LYELPRRPDVAGLAASSAPSAARLDTLPATVQDGFSRNAVRIERTFLDMPTSKMRRGIAQVLKDEGYVWDFEEIETTPARTLRLHLKYGPNGERLITKIDRISKPGRRIYRGYKELKPILGGMGIQILSTPRGIVSDRRARVEKIGGEVLAMIY